MRDREDWRLARFQLIGLGVLMNSALYLAMVFVAALAERATVACDLSIAAAGVTYLSWLAQSRPTVHSVLTILLLGASIVLGAAAGLTLLIGI